MQMLGESTCRRSSIGVIGGTAPALAAGLLTVKQKGRLADLKNAKPYLPTIHRRGLSWPVLAPTPGGASVTAFS
jgi:hypothetical protein